jgi:membrane-associated phospholipid phosphatase
MMIISYLVLDRPVAMFFARYPGIYKHEIIQFLTYLGLGWIYLIGLPLLALGFKSIRMESVSRKLFYIWGCICASGISVTALKICLSRVRPYLLIAKGYYGFFWWNGSSDYWSFPSGHSTMIFTFALAYCLMFVRYRAVVLFLALVIALSRVVVLAHFLSDIMAAFLLSNIVVLAVFDKYKTIKLFQNNLISMS